MKNIILCDIDGTIANNDHRQHFLEDKKDWDSFFLKMSDDAPIMEVIEKVKESSSKINEIIFLTGRPERYRKETEKWLSNYFDDYSLIMRENGDRRNKVLVKDSLYSEISSRNIIDLVFENDPELINLWESKGLTVIDANKLRLNK